MSNREMTARVSPYRWYGACENRSLVPVTRAPVTDTLLFLREFARHPFGVGAVAPSSAALARMMVDGMGLDEARYVVEYGPGLGAFTPEIVARMPTDSTYFAIEQNDTLRSHFAARFPHLRVFEGSAVDVDRFADSVDADGIDCLVSGLPWASFCESLQDAILNATTSVLNRGARFTTFAYVHGLALPSGRAFRRKLHTHFRSVTRSPVVWSNLPPAFVYRCQF